MRAILFLTICGTLSMLVACGGGKSGNAGNNTARSGSSVAGAMNNAYQGGLSASARKPNCGAVQPVWVNLNTKVYHEPGDPAYGMTKRGEYLCPSAAKAQGYRAAGEARHHRRKSAESST